MTIKGLMTTAALTALFSGSAMAQDEPIRIGVVTPISGT